MIQRVHRGPTAPCSSRTGSPSFGSPSVSALKPTRFRAWLCITGGGVLIVVRLHTSTAALLQSLHTTTTDPMIDDADEEY